MEDMETKYMITTPITDVPDDLKGVLSHEEIERDAHIINNDFHIDTVYPLIQNTVGNTINL